MLSSNNRKVGILTLMGSYNFGNKLQNYALQETLKGLGFYPETICNDRNSGKQNSLTKRFLGTSLADVPMKIKKKYSNYLNEKILNKRKELFVEFAEEYINETDYIISKNNIPEGLSDLYDCFICGSDQVWNPNHLHGTSFYFLTFAERKKRISYAASLGVSEIPEKYVEQYRSWLSQMHRISVREKSGARIVKEISGRDAEVHLDPTLLISKNHWLSISREPDYKPASKYLLTYFLGDMPKEIKMRINNLAKTRNLSIINLADLKSPETYIAGPREFIDLINSASLFCTDSFHGVAFSILMETPFIGFQRQKIGHSMYLRIELLLEKLGLEERQYKKIFDRIDIFEMDFSHVYPVLEQERSKALNYLKEALIS